MSQDFLFNILKYSVSPHCLIFPFSAFFFFFFSCLNLSFFSVHRVMKPVGGAQIPCISFRRPLAYFFFIFYMHYLSILVLSSQNTRQRKVTNRCDRPLRWTAVVMTWRQTNVTSSRYQAHAIYTPWTPLLYSKTVVFRGIHYFFIIRIYKSAFHDLHCFSVIEMSRYTNTYFAWVCLPNVDQSSWLFTGDVA